VDERTRELIAEARYELDSPRSIDDLGLQVRTYNILRRDGIDTLSDLTSRSEEDLLALEQFGPACLEDAKKELSYYGLKLAVPLPRAEVARLRLANHQESDYPHRCFTDEGDWVSCPPELCEADFLLREALIRTDEIARLAGLLRTECGSASRFREIYGGSEIE
jgi:hypothetical protein